MRIISGIEIIDLALYITKEKTLIISDVHIGYEEALNKQGILVPRFQFKDTVKRLNNILKRVKPKTIIINGDLKHEFGTISDQEWRDTLKVLDLLSKHGKVILLKGNHDTILGPIANKRNVEIKEHYKINDILITHGDKIPKITKGVKTIIIGHEHPAISLKENVRIEKFKCYLKGKWKRKILIVMPSFFLVTEGTDIIQEKTLSPFLKQKLGNFEVFVVGNKVYKFGKLKDII